jgi:hypothetical protein
MYRCQTPVRFPDTLARADKLREKSHPLHPIVSKRDMGASRAVQCLPLAKRALFAENRDREPSGKGEGNMDCSWTGCERASGTKLAERALCPEHFLQDSHRRVATIQEMFTDNSEERNFSLEVQSFLSEVISQAAILATETKFLAPSQRDNLIELSTTAAKVYKRIQGARTVRRVRCLLRTGVASTELPEKCFTVNISQRGACLEIRQALRASQMITLERLDTGSCARGRVAWITQTGPEKFTAGVEILDAEDFWGLEQHRRNCEADALGART